MRYASIKASPAVLPAALGVVVPPPLLPPPLPPLAPLLLLLLLLLPPTPPRLLVALAVTVRVSDMTHLVLKEALLARLTPPPPSPPSSCFFLKLVPGGRAAAAAAATHPTLEVVMVVGVVAVAVVVRARPEANSRPPALVVLPARDRVTLTMDEEAVVIREEEERALEAPRILVSCALLLLPLNRAKDAMAMTPSRRGLLCIGGVDERLR
jgi:hypothetical protein